MRIEFRILGEKHSVKRGAHVCRCAISDHRQENRSRLLTLTHRWRYNTRTMVRQLRRYPFVQVDVFSAKPFEGNPLAVFTDGRGLSDQEMQALALEMNLAETTFILPRESSVERERGVRVRIFTVQEELPFAGHPTLGTAFQLRGSTGAHEVALDLNVGKVPVQFEEKPGQPTFGEMTQVNPEFRERHDRETVVRACGLRDGDIDPSLPIQTISTGVPFTVVPLRGLEIARGLHVDMKGSAEYLARSGGKFFYFVSRETVDPAARLHARMMFYNGEDPATGSAAGCAAAWMVANGVAQPDERVLIEQGVEMKRPSQIFVRASRKDDRVVNVRVGGNVVEVLRGEVAF
jgi:trans-2,3-dihydro-3-hydroxyanthranilate isomerase